MSHPAIAAGRTAVITGAASGIGLAAARALAAKGMTIAMLDLPGPRLEAAAATLTGSRAFPLDVSDALAVGAAAATIAKEMPPTTLLFNNAGFGLPSSALADREAWDRTLAVNFGGILTVAQAFIPGILANGLPAAGCCQTNANQSLFAQTRSPSGRAKLTPLGESGSAVSLEICPAIEGAVRVEQVVD